MSTLQVSNDVCGHGIINYESDCPVCKGRFIRRDIPQDVRTFTTGATRSADNTRDNPEGYLSPLVIDRFCQYMTKHRKQPDGSVRDADNWQRGLPLQTYIEGGWRHFLHWWTRHRGWKVRDPLAAADIQEDLCAIIFNASGYLHELLKKEQENGNSNSTV